MANAVAVPRFAFIKAWEWWAGTAPHPVVGADTFWFNDTAQATLEAKVNALLDQAGVAGGGVPTREFRRMLNVLARPEREVSAWVAQTETSETGGILVAFAGRDAVRVVRDETTVIVDEVRPDNLCDALIDVLPDVPAAPMQDLTIPASRYEKVRDESYEFGLESRYSQPDPAGTVRELLNAPRTGLHQMYVGITSRGGRMRSNPITALDLTGQGRILTFLGPGENRHEPNLHCTPGGRNDLVEIFEATQKTLVDG